MVVVCVVAVVGLSIAVGALVDVLVVAFFSAIFVIVCAALFFLYLCLFLCVVLVGVVVCVGCVVCGLSWVGFANVCSVIPVSVMVSVGSGAVVVGGGVCSLTEGVSSSLLVCSCPSVSYQGGDLL